MYIDAVRPQELDETELNAWHRAQLLLPDFASAFQSPGWAKLVGDVRPDVQVCVIECADGAPQAFLPVQRMSGYAAMGCGAPIAERQGLIGAPPEEVCERAIAKVLKVDRLDFANVPFHSTCLPEFAFEGEPSWTLTCPQGFAAFEAEKRAQGSNTLRDMRRRMRRTEREMGPITIHGPSKNAEAFAKMISWKQAHFARTHQPDIFARPWVRDVIWRSFEEGGEGLTPLFFHLNIGDEVVAGLYYLGGPGKRIANAWFISHNPDFDKASPGFMLWVEAAERLISMGYEELDFGPGEYRYKTSLCNGARTLVKGFIGQPSPASMLRHMAYRMRAAIETVAPQPLRDLPAKAMRKVDLLRGLKTA